MTNPADLEGFHKIEELLWADNTLTEPRLSAPSWSRTSSSSRQLVSTASYDPVTMASGATDLINEAATSKITGEEERYSNTDLIVFQANVDGAMEVFSLLKPHLQKNDPLVVSQIQKRYQRWSPPSPSTRPRPATTTPAMSSTRRFSIPSVASSRPRCRPSPKRCPRCPAQVG